METQGLEEEETSGGIALAAGQRCSATVMPCLGTVAAQLPKPRRLRRRRLRPRYGAGRWQPPPAVEHLLPGPSAHRLLHRNGAAVARRQRCQRLWKQRGFSSAEASGRKGGRLSVVSQLPPYLPHRLLSPSAAWRNHVQVEGRRFGKAIGAASSGGPPFGHPLKCCEWAAPSPEGALSRAKYELEPRNSF